MGSERQNHWKYIGFYMFLWIYAVSENIEKTMPKWVPKWTKNGAKSTPVDTHGRFILVFMDFGRCRKIAVFECRPGASKNQQKSSLGALRGRKGASGCSPSVPPQPREGPASASRASFGLKNSSKRAQQHVLTRHRAQGPANLRFFTAKVQVFDMLETMQTKCFKYAHIYRKMHWIP